MACLPYAFLSVLSSAPLLEAMFEESLCMKTVQHLQSTFHSLLMHHQLCQSTVDDDDDADE